MELTNEQKEVLGRYLEEFRTQPTVSNDGEIIAFNQFDHDRMAAIPEMRQLVNDYLLGKTSMQEFKQNSETLCRKLPYWGFKGFSGQMQLNQYVNNIPDSPEKDQILKSALRIPNSKDEARAKINDLAQYLGVQKTSVDNPKSIPRTNQSFMLSYFWAMQEGTEWLVFYGSTRKLLSDIGFILDVAETPGDEYVLVVEIFEALKHFFSDGLGVKEEHMLWQIEHILWKQYTATGTEERETTGGTASVRLPKKEYGSPDSSWIPPIVADLEELAANRETAWSVARGVKPEKAFETKLRHAFTLLGYQATELGQGTGREPDGIAISSQTPDGYYALVYDAKAREQSFSIGTSDREIVEYIKKKQQELGRQRVSKLSFLIVSSEFTYNATMKETLTSIFRATRVPVILVRASDLLYIIEQKLRNYDIDHARLENLFLETGLLTQEKILGEIGG